MAINGVSRAHKTAKVMLYIVYALVRAAAGQSVRGGCRGAFRGCRRAWGTTTPRRACLLPTLLPAGSSDPSGHHMGISNRKRRAAHCRVVHRRHLRRDRGAVVHTRR